MQLEQMAPGMVLRVQAGLVAAGVVAPTALVARWVRMSVIAGVPQKVVRGGRKGITCGRGSWSKSVKILFLCLGEPLCHGH